jgi:transporter family-2 protein
LPQKPEGEGIIIQLSGLSVGITENHEPGGSNFETDRPSCDAGGCFRGFSFALVAISGLTTGLVGLSVALVFGRPELSSRAVGYSVASGVLGAVIVGSIAVAASQGGVARALSLVIGAQLIFSLILDRLGLFGAGASDVTLLKVVGVALILLGGVLVVRY